MKTILSILPALACGVMMLACVGLMRFHKKPDSQTDETRAPESDLQAEVDSLRAQVEELKPTRDEPVKNGEEHG